MSPQMSTLKQLDGYKHEQDIVRIPFESQSKVPFLRKATKNSSSKLKESNATLKHLHLQDFTSAPAHQTPSEHLVQLKHPVFWDVHLIEVVLSFSCTKLPSRGIEFSDTGIELPRHLQSVLFAVAPNYTTAPCRFQTSSHRHAGIIRIQNSKIPCN